VRLRGIYGAADWDLITVCSIAHALPASATGSIQGTLASGRRGADQVLATVEACWPPFSPTGDDLRRHARSAWSRAAWSGA
jgi:hypothetical protein